MTFLALTWQGYTFLAVLIVSFYVAHLFDKRDPSFSMRVGLLGTIIFSILLFPLMFSLAIWEKGTTARIALVTFWIIGISVVYLFQKKRYAKLRINILKWVLYLLCALAILGFDIALMYFLYQVFITGEKSDAPLWAILVCFFFVVLLTVLIGGWLINLFRQDASEEKSR